MYIATSIDGYIARNDGSIDWLDEANGLVPEGEDCGFKVFMDSVDTLVMGPNLQILTTLSCCAMLFWLYKVLSMAD